MKLSLKQAADAVGMSKPTLQRAIKTGRLSAARGVGREYIIDYSELVRVYPHAKQPAVSEKHQMKRDETPDETAELRAALATEREKARLLDEQVTDLRKERDRLIGVIEGQTRVLEDLRPRPAQESAGKVRWWQKFLGH